MKNQRCFNYNECEVKDSELLWNQCIYEESNGKYLNNFCNDNSEESKNLIKICEKN